MKIVGPTIMRPWQQRIDAVDLAAAGRELLGRACARSRSSTQRVAVATSSTSPTANCAQLEATLKERIRTLAAEQGLPVPPGP